MGEYRDMATMTRGNVNVTEGIEIAKRFAASMNYEVEEGSVTVERAEDLGSGPRAKVKFRARIAE